jgi:hypothetical protein
VGPQSSPKEGSFDGEWTDIRFKLSEEKHSVRSKDTREIPGHVTAQDKKSGFASTEQHTTGRGACRGSTLEQEQ